MKKQILALASILTITAISTASAQTIAQWTFETSVPSTAGPHAAEVGAGSALGFHAGTTTYSNPVGNGSAESFSSNGWGIGDYYQFSVSTLGYSGISVSWDQASSGTGPRDFSLAYSTDGVAFTPFASYEVLITASPNAWSSSVYQSMFTFDYDLSSITALDNAPTVFFRLENTSNVSAAGGAVASAGSSRVDNFTVSVVPEPASATLLGLGLTVWLIRRRK
jgi:hypothetical protein